MFLGGPPLVKMATGEETDDESLGGAEMHARVSGLADYFAVDEHGRAPDRPPDRRPAELAQARGPSRADVDEPRYDADELLGIVPADLKVPFDPREVIARIVDDSDFDEFKPLYGTSLVDRLGAAPRLPGRHPRQRPRRAVQRGVAEGGPVHPARQPERHPAALPAQHHRLHGRPEYEQGGIIKHGAMMINAVSNSHASRTCPS